MSAFATADVPSHASGAAMCYEATYAVQQTTWLFDHLVGAREQRRRHVEAERFGALEIDQELELDWKLDGKLARVLALQNSVHITCRAPPVVGVVVP